MFCSRTPGHLDRSETPAFQSFEQVSLPVVCSGQTNKRADPWRAFPVSMTIQDPSVCRKPQREGQGPVHNCSSYLISDLLGSHPSVSQSKLPNLSPAFMCISEWKHHPSSILPSFPLFPISHIHYVPKSYLFGFQNSSQIQLLLPSSLN